MCNNGTKEEYGLVTKRAERFTGSCECTRVRNSNVLKPVHLSKLSDIFPRPASLLPPYRLRHPFGGRRFPFKGWEFYSAKKVGFYDDWCPAIREDAMVNLVEEIALRC